MYLKHKKDWNKYTFLNNSHRNYTNRIFNQKMLKSIDRSLHPIGLISNNKTSQNNKVYFKNKHPKQHVI